VTKAARKRPAVMSEENTSRPASTPPAVKASVLEPPHLPQRQAEMIQRCGFMCPVTPAARAIAADSQDHEPVIKPPPPRQVLTQAKRQGYGDLIAAGAGRQRDSRSQAGPFSIQPCQSLIRAREPLRDRRACQRRQVIIRRRCAGLVVAEQPAGGLLLLPGVAAG
jgi:hypothetical protein